LSQSSPAQCHQLGDKRNSGLPTVGMQRGLIGKARQQKKTSLLWNENIIEFLDQNLSNLSTRFKLSGNIS